jgi:hypothetical protein
MTSIIRRCNWYGRSICSGHIISSMRWISHSKPCSSSIANWGVCSQGVMISYRLHLKHSPQCHPPPLAVPCHRESPVICRWMQSTDIFKECSTFWCRGPLEDIYLNIAWDASSHFIFHTIEWQELWSVGHRYFNDGGLLTRHSGTINLSSNKLWQTMQYPLVLAFALSILRLDILLLRHGFFYFESTVNM